MNVIDLGKQHLQNPMLIIQECFQISQDRITGGCLKITYQYNIPINFLINPKKILPGIKLEKLNNVPRFQPMNSNSHLIPFTEDFYLDGLDPKNLISQFVIFIYTGKLEYRIREEFLPLLKLALYFQCDILITNLINQIQSIGITRNFFLNFIIDIFNEQNYFQVLLSNQNEHALKFVECIILENAPIIINHVKWHEFGRKEAQEKIQKAFRQVNPKIFNQFANIFIKNGPEKVIHLTQFLYFIAKYDNPNVEILENIYLGRVFQFSNDEQFIKQNENWLTNRCKQILSVQIKRIEDPPFHMTHTKICDLVQYLKKFYQKQILQVHLLTLNMPKLSKFKQFNQNKPQKIRCFSRFLHQDYCNGIFQDQDFLQLREYPADELLNLFLQNKI